MRIIKVAKTRPEVEPTVSRSIREYNRLDVELYEFGKKLFEQSLRKNENAVREGLTTLRAIPRSRDIETLLPIRHGRRKIPTEQNRIRNLIS